MKALKKILDFITSPFISVAVFLDEEKRLNLDGKYDEYWRKKNERAARKEQR